MLTDEIIPEFFEQARRALEDERRLNPDVSSEDHANDALGMDEVNALDVADGAIPGLGRDDVSAGEDTEACPAGEQGLAVAQQRTDVPSEAIPTSRQVMERIAQCENYIAQLLVQNRQLVELVSHASPGNDIQLRIPRGMKGTVTIKVDEDAGSNGLHE